jgi:hypothetical protein
MTWRSIIQGGGTAGQGASSAVSQTCMQGSFSFPPGSSNMLMLPRCWSQKAYRFLLDIKVIICLLNLSLCLFLCVLKSL